MCFKTDSNDAQSVKQKMYMQIYMKNIIDTKDPVHILADCCLLDCNKKQ